MPSAARDRVATLVRIALTRLWAQAGWGRYGLGVLVPLTGALGAGPLHAEVPGQTIGSSQDGRPLTVYEVGSGPRALFIMGGQHGGPEVNTVRLAWELLSHFGENPQEIPPELRLVVMPEANPDGLARGSRQYVSGVDPNRNWGGADWASDAADSNGAFRRGLGGAEPFSEPETQAIRDYVLALKPALVINYHSRGGFILGGRAGTLAEAYARASGYSRPTAGAGGVSGVLGYRATGSMNVWLGEQGIPGMLIELATNDDPEFARNLAGLRSVMAMLASEEQPSAQALSGSPLSRDGRPLLSWATFPAQAGSHRPAKHLDKVAVHPLRSNG